MHPRRRIAISLLLTVALLAACSPVPTAVSDLNSPPGIANLLKDRLKTQLTGAALSTAPFTFPGRVRIIPYDYQSSLQPADVLTQFQVLAQALANAPDVVSDATVLPATYGDSIGTSFDGLIALHDSLRADIFLLVSGRSTTVEDPALPVWFFDRWGGKSYWEAETNLDALFVDAQTGRLIPSLQAAADEGPQLFINSDQATSGAAYELRKKVENEAFAHLAASLAAPLRTEHAAPPLPTPSPGTATPRPTATINPVAGALVLGVLVGLLLAPRAIAGAAHRQLLDDGDAPLANASVFVANADGSPIAAYPSVTTDASGNFRIPNVPVGSNFRLVASATQAGKPVQLSTMVKVGTGETATQIDSVSTLITTAVLQNATGLVCNFDAGAFADATAAVTTGLGSTPVPDLTDPAAILATIAQLTAAAPAIGVDIAKLASCL